MVLRVMWIIAIILLIGLWIYLSLLWAKPLGQKIKKLYRKMVN